MGTPENSAPATDMTGIAVAIGGLQVRVEEGFKGVKESIDKLTELSSAHSDTLARHDVEIAILKERQPKKTPWYFIVSAVLGIITVTFAVVGSIVATVQAVLK